MHGTVGFFQPRPLESSNQILIFIAPTPLVHGTVGFFQPVGSSHLILTAHTKECAWINSTVPLGFPSQYGHKVCGNSVISATYDTKWSAIRYQSHRGFHKMWYGFNFPIRRHNVCAELQEHHSWKHLCAKWTSRLRTRVSDLSTAVLAMVSKIHTQFFVMHMNAPVLATCFANLSFVIGNWFLLTIETFIFIFCTIPMF